jgi:hypothetical protein
MACTAISTTTMRASLLPFAPGQRSPSRHAATTTTATARARTRRGLHLPPLLLRASTTGGADSDDDQEARVLEVTRWSAARGKLVVLEVRRKKGSPASEDFAPKFSCIYPWLLICAQGCFRRQVWSIFARENL